MIDDLKGIDWNITLIGGSYALHSFLKLKDPSWEPNDIDIFIAGNKRKINTFNKYVMNIIQVNNGTVIKTRDADATFRIGTWTEENDGKEDFHKDIFRTITVNFPISNLPIQFVGIHLEKK